MTNVIHPAKTIAQKLVIDDATMVLLQAACDAHDKMRESWNTVANRFFVIGFRAEHLKQKGGDKEIINIVDNYIAKTMPEMARKLFSMKPVDLNATDKGLRITFMKDLNDKRTALAKALAKCDEPDAGTTGTTPTEPSDIVAGIIKDAIEKTHTFSVVNAKTGKCKLEGVNIVELLKHLQAAVKELT
jgi:hypothetical protein